MSYLKRALETVHMPERGIQPRLTGLFRPREDGEVAREGQGISNADSDRSWTSLAARPALQVAGREPLQNEAAPSRTEPAARFLRKDLASKGSPAQPEPAVETSVPEPQEVAPGEGHGPAEQTRESRVEFDLEGPGPARPIFPLNESRPVSTGSNQPSRGRDRTSGEPPLPRRLQALGRVAGPGSGPNREALRGLAPASLVGNPAEAPLSTSAEPRRGPTVHVRIGRIELRAEPKATAPPPAPKPYRPRISLADYLKEREKKLV